MYEPREKRVMYVDEYNGLPRSCIVVALLLKFSNQPKSHEGGSYYISKRPRK